MKAVRGKRKACLVAARKPSSDQRGDDQRCMTIPLRQGNCTCFRSAEVGDDVFASH